MKRENGFLAGGQESTFYDRYLDDSEFQTTSADLFIYLFIHYFGPSLTQRI